MSSMIIPVILSGGAGTRLWPASRESMPKQFMRLIGDRSTFQEAVLRVSDPAFFERPVIIAANDARFLIAEQLQEIGVEADIILEPARRDSAAAVGVAAEAAARRNTDGVALVMAPFLIAFALMSPVDALIAVVGIVVAAGSATLIQLWFRTQAKRTQFRRRQTSSRMATFAEAFSSITWAATAGLAAAGTWTAIIPGGAAFLILAGTGAIRPR